MYVFTFALSSSFNQSFKQSYILYTLRLNISTFQVDLSRQVPLFRKQVQFRFLRNFYCVKIYTTLRNSTSSLKKCFCANIVKGIFNVFFRHFFLVLVRIYFPFALRPHTCSWVLDNGRTSLCSNTWCWKTAVSHSERVLYVSALSTFLIDPCGNTVPVPRQVLLSDSDPK